MPCTKAVQVHLHKRKLAPLYLFFTLNEGKPLFFFFFPFPSSPFSFSFLTVPDTASQHSVVPSGGGAAPCPAGLPEMSPRNGWRNQENQDVLQARMWGCKPTGKGLSFCYGLLPLFLSLFCLAVNIFCNLIASSFQESIWSPAGCWLNRKNSSKAWNGMGFVVIIWLGGCCQRFVVVVDFFF